jgi:hypothetical protein
LLPGGIVGLDKSGVDADFVGRSQEALDESVRVAVCFGL